MPWLAAAIALAAVAGVIGWRAKAPPPDNHVVTRFEYPLAEGQRFARTGRRVVDVSRDGRKLVYNTAQHIYLQPMDRMKGEPIQGTTGDSMEPIRTANGSLSST